MGRMMGRPDRVDRSGYDGVESEYCIGFIPQEGVLRAIDWPRTCPAVIASLPFKTGNTRTKCPRRLYKKDI